MLMTASWVVADQLQPADYSPVRQSISVLAGHAGRDRWIVTAALIVVGTCYLCTAYAAAALTRLARLGLVIAGLSAIGIALSPEPVHGSTPQHLAWTAVGAIAIAIWPLLAIRTDAPRWATAGWATGIVVGAGYLVLLGWTFAETRNGTTLGLAERVSSSVQLCWPVIRTWSSAASRSPAEVDSYMSRVSASSGCEQHSSTSPGDGGTSGGST